MQRHTVRGGPEVTGSEQADECCVDGIPRPTVGRLREVRADLSTPLAGADEGQHGDAHRVFLGLAVVVEHLEWMIGTGAGAFDHLRPPVVVRVVELVKEPDQGGVGRRPDPVGQARLEPFIPPALDHSGPTYHIGHQRAQIVLRLGQAGLHAVARLDTFGRRWHPLVLQGGLRSAPIGDEAFETFRPRPRHEDVDDGTVRPGRTRIGDHCVLARSPTVAHPYGDVTPTVRWGIGAEVEGEPARFLARSVGQPGGTHHLVDRLAEKRSALGRHARAIVREPASAISELGLPVAALPGLQAVLVAELHQRAGVHQFVEEHRQAAA